jgi:hypothetical protein
VSTQINVAVDSGGLREQARQLQNAARQAQLEKERTTRVEQDATALRAQKQASGATGQLVSSGSAPGQSANTFARFGPSFKPVLPQEEPAAQRVSTGTVAGVEWRITFSPLNTTAMTSIDTTEFMTLTVGPPGHAVTASVNIPNSRRQAAVASYYDLIIREDRLFSLPLGKNTCLFVFHRNFLRSIEFPGGKETFPVHATFTFVVSPTAARLISAPDALKANLDDVYPRVTVNSTREQILVQAPDGQVISSVTVDAFDGTLWANGSRYGVAINYSTTSSLRRATVLALQYGILNADPANYFSLSDYLTYFSPAVYTFIKGPMTLDANAVQYEYMRSTYFANAPRFFLKRCALEITCTTEKTGFDVTRTTPVTLDTAIPAANFNAAKKYDVALNGYQVTGSFLISLTSVRYPGLAFAWDWENPTYCRQQATTLGFSGADFTP